jgi:acyl-CoA thioesterase I
MNKTVFIILQKLILFSFLIICSVDGYATKNDDQRILVLGDSISAGYGLPTGVGWVSLLEKELKKQQYSFNLINASISGETSAGGRARISQLLSQHKPTVVILELGANDALRGFPLKSTYQNLQEIIHLSKASQAKVLILGMRIPSNYGAEYTQQFATMFLDLSKNTQSSLVPFFLEKIATNRQYFQEDGIHPTQEAQPLLLNQMLPSLMKLLK